MKRRAVVLAAAASALAGCGLFGSKPPPPPPAAPAETTLELTLTGGKQLNPNVQNRPSSAVVRVFDLKTTAAFEAATFEGLFERDREVLGAEVVGREEITLKPGDSLKVPERKIGPEIRALGIAVGFRELERATWRAIVPLKANAKNRVNVLLDGVTVMAAQVP